MFQDDEGALYSVSFKCKALLFWIQCEAHWELRAVGCGSCCEGVVHTALLAVLSQIYRGTPFLVKWQTTTCSHFISPVLAVPLGPLVKGRHPGTPWGMKACFPFKTFPIHFLMAATCSSPSLYHHHHDHIHSHTHHTSLPHEGWADCWGIRVDCHCHRGQRRKGGGYSMLLDGPQVPDVTLFNDIIMSVSRLPLAFSLYWKLCKPHTRTWTHISMLLLFKARVHMLLEIIKMYFWEIVYHYLRKLNVLLK